MATGSFLNWGSATLLAFRSTIVVGLGAMVRCLTPSVLYEQAQYFRIGSPADYPFGPPTFLAKEKVFVFHDQKEGFSVASAFCRQLGCVVFYSQDDGCFHCPCHGSTYSAAGAVVYGPAHKLAPWFEVFLTRDGQLIVNKDLAVPAACRLMV